MKRDTSFPTQLAVLAFFVIGLFLLMPSIPAAPEVVYVAPDAQVSASAASEKIPAEGGATSTAPAELAQEQTAMTDEGTAIEEPQVSDTVAAAENGATTASQNEVHRTLNPYPFPAYPFEIVNVSTRAALVNIYCWSTNGLLRPISGSGVFVDAKGVILTNSHVAQYVLLAESGTVNLQCHIRAGAPAKAAWRAHVLYISPAWIKKHAADIKKDRPLGTGEHDYALLYAGAPVDGTIRPTAFPYISPDTRDTIGFTGDQVLAASYPAEFLGTIASNSSLYPVTSLTEIENLYTLDTRTVDVVSIGSVIGAQSGSSGGAVVNAWSRLIGIITTTSDGKTTGERDLRAITLSYIDRDLEAQSGSSLAATLERDPAAQSVAFWSSHGHSLVAKLLTQLK